MDRGEQDEGKEDAQQGQGEEAREDESVKTAGNSSSLSHAHAQAKEHTQQTGPDLVGSEEGGGEQQHGHGASGTVVARSKRGKKKEKKQKQQKEQEGGDVAGEKKCSGGDGGGAAQICSLEDLPGPAQAIITSMFPDGDTPDNRLRLSVLSRTTLGFHGSTLTTVFVRQGEDNERVEPLIALLRRQKKLERIEWMGQSSRSSTLVTLLASGCLRRVWSLKLLRLETETDTPLEEFQRLTLAMQEPGAMDALKVLRASGMNSHVVKALASGVAPSLRSLYLCYGVLIYDRNLEALAAMLEARQRAGRPGLEEFALGIPNHVMEGCSDAARRRLLCALLPSVTKMDFRPWGDAL